MDENETTAPVDQAPPEPARPRPSPSALEAEDFIARLATALHRFGSPAHRLEESMSRVTTRLGLRGEFFCTPTAIFASFRSPGAQLEPAHTVLLRVEPGEVNLEKLSLLDGILGRVLQGDVDLDAAKEQIAEIVSRPMRFGPLLTHLAWGTASAATARFFGGGPLESLVAAAVGVGIGLLATLAGRHPSIARLFESLAAAAAALAASAAAAMWGSSFFVVTISALIVLMPGLTLTTAVSELATRHLVSGSARLGGALLVFMTMAVGFAFGSQLGVRLFGPISQLYPPPQPTWTELLALLVSACSLLVLFRADPRDGGIFLASAGIALFGSRLGAHFLGPQLGALAGAALIGIVANLYARWRDRPSALVQMPGLMLLVPGSMGFRSVAALLEQDTISGIQTGFTVVLVAISLATGLLIANAVVPPRRVP
jgi:uncharacterized membrane protein YjjP (DUF1212 family)